MIVISVAPKRYSHECLDHCPEFALCLPSKPLAKGAWICGTKSGRQVDKFELTEFDAKPSKVIRPPLIGGSTVAFECKVVERVTTGDHTLFIAEVVATHGDAENAAHLYSIHYRKLVSLSHTGEADFEVD